MSDDHIFDLRAQALRLIAHTSTYETSDALVSEGLAQFHSLQDAIRKSVQRLEDARIAAAKPVAIPPPPAPVTQSPRAQAPAFPPGTRFETSQTQYAGALADEDVIQALLQLHNEVEIEKRIAKVQMERTKPPEADPADFEQMRFSRTRQSSRGVFSPILKPPRRDSGRTE